MHSIYISLPSKNCGEYPNGGNEYFWMSKIAHKLASCLGNNVKTAISSSEMRTPSVVRQSNSESHNLHLILQSETSIQTGNLKGSQILYLCDSKKGKKYAEIVAEEYRKIYPEPNLVTVLSNSSIDELKLIKSPVILIKTAYHDNPQDEIWLTNSTDEIAHALATALHRIFAEETNA